MNHILIDHYRSRKKLVDNSDRISHPFDEALLWVEQEAGVDIEELQRSLELLAQQSERQHAVVTHRFFGGLTISETAELLNVSAQTVERDWRLARVKLLRSLN